MKKCLAGATALLLCLSLAACESNISENDGIIGNETAKNQTEQNQTGQGSDASNAAESTQIAVITYGMSEYDDGLLSDILEMAKGYASDNNLKYNEYAAEEQTQVGYLNAIRSAVDDGAKVIVLKGEDFEVPVFHAQELYPDVSFILVDGVPNNGDQPPVYRTNDNVANIMFADEQMGYLAGYAAVKEGYKNLGYIGYRNNSCAKRYGYGFVQGAEAAANENGVTGVTVEYQYLDDFRDSDFLKKMTGGWFDSNVELVAVYGDMLQDAAISAAEGMKGKKVILSAEYDDNSDAFLASVARNTKDAIDRLVSEYFSGTFPGGQTVRFDASNGGISLNMQNAGFTKFNEDDYKNVFRKMASGDISINTTAETIDALELRSVRVNTNTASSNSGNSDMGSGASNNTAQSNGNANNMTDNMLTR